jgi:chromate reductase, NAD(P)H dehydrogenase (quinone)
VSETPTSPRPAFTAIAFSGSLRADSSNTGLVHMAVRLAPDDLAIKVVNDLVWALPFYNADWEDAPPDEVLAWRDALTAADALIIGMPEYNFLPTAVAKNAVDWVSRPYGKHILNHKVVAMLTSAGKGGGSKVQASIAPIIGLLGNTVVEEPKVQIVFGAERIGADGTTTDPEVEPLVRAKLDAVVDALRNP